MHHAKTVHKSWFSLRSPTTLILMGLRLSRQLHELCGTRFCQSGLSDCILAGLEELGLIERGDASIVASYINRADRRPQGWNLRLDKISGVPLVQVVEVRGASSAGNGVHLVHERGAGDAPKPYIEPSIEPSSVFMSEAVQLCNLLANLIHENGSRLPKVTNRWIQDMEKIMRLDCRTPQQVEMAIRWCQKSSFWKANILSPSKLRDKYDQLRLQASREMASHSLSGLSDFLAES
jgi:hypothetical protein